MPGLSPEKFLSVCELSGGRIRGDELWEAAKVYRLANVMRPYLESLR